jgi:hypothetical protein
LTGIDSQGFQDLAGYSIAPQDREEDMFSPDLLFT